MEHIGIFPLYAIGATLVMIALTFAINFTRGVVLVLLGLSVAYYYGFASTDSKSKMDFYAERLSKSITNSKFLETVSSDTISKITKTNTGTSKALSDYANNLKGF